MDSPTSEAPPRRGPPPWLAWPTALIPGLGPAIRGQLSLAVLLFAASFWLRLMLAGHADPVDRIEAFLFGAFGATGGLKNPTFVFVTLLTLGTHALAVCAWLSPTVDKKKEAQGS